MAFVAALIKQLNCQKNLSSQKGGLFLLASFMKHYLRMLLAPRIQEVC